MVSSCHGGFWDGLSNAAWGSHVFFSTVESVDRARSQDSWWGRPMILSKFSKPDWKPGMDPKLHAESPAQHRYPVWWTGDYAPLEASLETMVDAGLYDLKPFVHSDCGGDIGNAVRGTAGNLIRWTAHCAYGSILRFHGGDHRAWNYNTSTVDTLRAYLDARYRLMPSFIAAGQAASRTGLPLAARGDFFWPEHAESSTNHQYLLFEDILVAPIWDTVNNESSRSVWVPPGAWQDAWDGSRVVGPRTINVTQPFERIPMWHRAEGGLIVMTSSRAANVQEQDWSTLTLEAFPAISTARVTHRSVFERSADQDLDVAQTLNMHTDRAGNVEFRIGTGPKRAWVLRTHLSPGQRVVSAAVDGVTLSPAELAHLESTEMAAGTPSYFPLAGAGSHPAPAAGPVSELRLPEASAARTVVLRVASVGGSLSVPSLKSDDGSNTPTKSTDIAAQTYHDTVPGLPHLESAQQGGAACTSVDDCYLGGECRASVCVCDAWRTAANCSQMNLLPVAGQVQVYPEAGWSSWGAQVIFAKGKYHMYSARFSNRCGLNSWWCNSEVIHAECDTPDGLFRTVGTAVVPPFAHNPAVSVAADGTVVVFHIGSGTTPRSKQGNCSGGISGLDTNGTRAWCAASLPLAGEAAAQAPRAGQKWSRPNIAYSPSGPSGPWTQLGGDSSWGADNPAPIFLDNGTVLLYAKFACNETINPRSAACYQYGLLRAEHWRAKHWFFVRMIEVFGEDVAAWRDQRGFYHMLLQGGPYRGTASEYLRSCAGHYHLASSKDGLEWAMQCDAAPMNSFNFPLINGTIVKVKRRERHFVLLGPDKQPLWLYNGVAGEDYVKEMGQDHTFSAAQRFGTDGQQWHEHGASVRAKTDDPVLSGSQKRGSALRRTGRANGRAALLWVDFCDPSFASACPAAFHHPVAWESIADGLARFPLTSADTVSFVNFQILSDGSFGSENVASGSASVVEMFGIPAVRRRLSQVQVSADIGCNAGIAAMRKLFGNSKPFIAAAVVKAVALNLSMFNVDCEINPHLITDQDAADMMAFVSEFAAAMHASSKYLSADLGRCRLAGFGGGFQNNCSNWVTQTQLDSVMTMQTYWHQMTEKDPNATLDDWKKEVAVNAEVLGRDKVIVGIDKGFGALNQSKAPGARKSTDASVKILAKALAYLETQQLRTVAVWGTHEVDDLFVSTLGSWLSGKPAGMKTDDPYGSSAFRPLVCPHDPCAPQPLNYF